MLPVLTPLMAESESIWQMIIAAVVGGGAIGGLIKLLDWWGNWRERRDKAARDKHDKERKDQQEDDDRDRVRTERYIERLQHDYEEIRRENHDLRDRMQAELNKQMRERVKAEKRAVWIKSLEAILRANGIEFPPWTNGPSELPDSDSEIVTMHGPDAPEPPPTGEQ